jgi:hypothetical protein
VRNKSIVVSTKDIGVNLAAVLLSLTSAGFAAYFIFLAPAVNTGISQAPVTEYLASANAIESDPFITGTVTKFEIGDVVQISKNRRGQIARYKFRVMANAQAYIDIFRNDEIQSINIKVGKRVPGIGKILAIENLNGNLYVQTDEGRLASEGVIFD